jgi:hypothetical protein
MNIDYAKIIETANERKLGLQRFEAASAGAEEQAASLLTALDFFINLNKAAQAIDKEGQLLVDKVVNRAYQVSFWAKNARDAAQQSSVGQFGVDARNLYALVEELRK